MYQYCVVFVEAEIRGRYQVAAHLLLLLSPSSPQLLSSSSFLFLLLLSFFLELLKIYQHTVR